MGSEPLSLPRRARGPPRAPISAAPPFWPNPAAAFLLMFSERKIRRKGYVTLSDRPSQNFPPSSNESTSILKAWPCSTSIIGSFVLIPRGEVLKNTHPGLARFVQRKPRLALHPVICHVLLLCQPCLWQKRLLSGFDEHQGCCPPPESPTKGHRGVC